MLLEKTCVKTTRPAWRTVVETSSSPGLFIPFWLGKRTSFTRTSQTISSSIFSYLMDIYSGLWKYMEVFVDSFCQYIAAITRFSTREFTVIEWGNFQCFVTFVFSKIEDTNVTSLINYWITIRDVLLFITLIDRIVVHECLSGCLC